MNRMRAAFNSLIKTEQYSRFPLQRTADGERHVEVKLSDDATDDANDIQEGGSPTFKQALRQSSRCTRCSLVVGILLIFTIGVLLGFFSHNKPQQTEPVACGAEKTVMEEVEEEGYSSPAEVQLTWKAITQLLYKKLTPEAFTDTLKDLNIPSRLAGSDGDMKLGNIIFDKFTQLEMKPWTDIHHVQLQRPDSKRPNRVRFGSANFQPTGYLAYSATGTVQGPLVYGNYGRKQDLDYLRMKNIKLNGSVLLLRAGNQSFAEQVNNAAAMGASAVLIYPDPQDFNYLANIELYGHVHLGSGDPYTPGFPSLNHTQFLPTQSCGLPKIPAQTITADMTTTLLQNIGGPEADASSSFIGGIKAVSYKLGGTMNATVEVNNVLVNTNIHNVFGVIKGFVDPDSYVVLGAHRDAWGPGYARASVGTSILLELAKVVHDMVENDRFRPKRSLVFASWSAGEYGSVGATEWLEAHMSTIDKRVVSYISLDGVIMGRGSFIASASPLLHGLLESTMRAVSSPLGSGTLYDMAGRSSWADSVLRPMSIDDPAYPFLAFAGIPSISFHFTSSNTEVYTYYGTSLDTMDHLNFATNHRTSEMTTLAAQVAGRMALRLIHNHVVSLDVTRYKHVISEAVVRVTSQIKQLSQAGQVKAVSPDWLIQAQGSFSMAANRIIEDISNTDLEEPEACRILNDRLMRVEHCLLSPYVSTVKTPFRHVLLGRGPHTLASIAEMTDPEELRTHLALATWNLQGCANAMAENIWDVDNEI